MTHMTHSRLEVNIWVYNRKVGHVGHVWVMDGSWMGHVRFQCVMDQKVRAGGYKWKPTKIMEKGPRFIELGAFYFSFWRLFQVFEPYYSTLGPERVNTGPKKACNSEFSSRALRFLQVKVQQRTPPLTSTCDCSVSCPFKVQKPMAFQIFDHKTHYRP